MSSAAIHNPVASKSIFAQATSKSLNDFAVKPSAQPKHELLTLKPDASDSPQSKPDLAQPSSSIWGRSFSPFKASDSKKQVAMNKKPNQGPVESTMAALEAKLGSVPTV